MVIEISVGIIALVAVAVVVFLVPTWIQLRRTTGEAERLLRRLNEDLPILFREATQAVKTMNEVAADLREASARVRVLGNAVGGIGETINQVQGLVRGGTGTLLTKAGSLAAGFRAAFEVFKNKSQSHHQGGSDNGG